RRKNLTFNVFKIKFNKDKVSKQNKLKRDMNNKLSCILTENYDMLFKKMIAYIVQNILEKNYKKQF
ncbi:MAG: hypothetical protein QXK02_03295, partial [Thermoplasmata archaeon]